MFEVKGTYREKNAPKKFTKTVDAKTEKRAREITVGLLGSNHKSKKRHVAIIGAREV